ncbi:uncharacterized protein LOC133828972 [Humulus lupulus]|uniref:uncharacterized protein LOC133828972 n=1 Tax=Humulus lupulus TaxID=3486 RepID=UPI002B40CFE8|nr:uncharacterized protein LOC133828972 [Humulus lupulus]
MAFNKVYLALLLLALVATTAHARVNLLRLFDNTHFPFCPAGSTTCSCDCIVVHGRMECTRTDMRQGDCPPSCSEDCDCDFSMCPNCWCSYKVEACPKICSSSTPAATMLDSLLVSKTN